jgi:hypothetical protein
MFMTLPNQWPTCIAPVGRKPVRTRAFRPVSGVVEVAVVVSMHAMIPSASFPTAPFGATASHRRRADGR